VLTRSASVNALLAERDLIAVEADKHLHALAVCLQRLVENGQCVTQQIHAVRGVSGVGVFRPPGVGIYRPLDVVPKGISKHPVDGAILPR
jgi:hypothetical protein